MTPSPIRIGYRTYCVKHMPEGFDDYGQHTPGLIYVKETSPPEMANSLLHEVLHGCWEVGGLKDSDPEEKVVTILANQLCQVFRDNPDFVKYMTESL